jgi:3-dehydroquinate synthase
LDRLGELLGGDSYTGPLALVSDSNVGPLYAERVRAGLRARGAEAYPINFPAGEVHKTLDTLRAIWSELVAAGVERGGMVLALGGGVVTDLAGFAAAAYLRGVPWAVLPTSLLGIVDASLGGKTGADLPQGKNLVGAFHAPRLVLADPATLDTLPQVELRSGIAEVVKAGVISDPELFSLCARGWGAVRERLDEVLCRAMAVKVRLIQADPYEQGPRMALNLGHTIGHGVEKASGYRLSHGQSVAIGMVAEARLAEMMGLAQPPLAVWIIQCLAGLGLPTEIPPDIQRDAILQAMRVDKKRAAGVVRFSLPARLGEVRVGVEFKSLEAALASLTDN